MFAIIKSGGRQLRVEPGSVVSVDHRTETEGQAVTFDDVLFRDTADQLDVALVSTQIPKMSVCIR